MAAKTKAKAEPGKMVIAPFVDSEGVTRLVEVTAEVAAVLAEVEPALKERLFRKPDGIEKVAEEDGYGSFWEGPRLRFTLLLGESTTWKGSMGFWGAAWDEKAQGWRWECQLCKGRRLPIYCYCLNCDRCGADRRIATGKAEEARAKGDGTLRGGLEGKR